MGKYVLFGSNGVQRGGMFNKPAEMPGGPAWLGYVRVKDVNDAVKKAKGARGTLVNGPMEVPGGDWIAQFVDPYGAMFAVHTLAADLKPAQPAAAALPRHRLRRSGACRRAGQARRRQAGRQAGSKAAARRRRHAAKKAPAKKKAAKKKAAQEEGGGQEREAPGPQGCEEEAAARRPRSAPAARRKPPRRRARVSRTACAVPGAHRLPAPDAAASCR